MILNYILFGGISAGVAFLWLSYLKTVDLFRPESWKKLFISFFAGWFSVLPPLLFQLTGTRFAEPYTLPFFLLDVGLIEEAGKLLMVFITLRFLLKTDEPVDFIVHASAIACGFAAVENVLYIDRYGLEVLRGRAVISVFMHIAFTALPVYGYALSHTRKLSKGLVLLNTLSGFILAVIAHGLYDFFLTVKGMFILAFFLFFVLVEVWLTQVNNLLNLSPWFSKKAVPSFRQVRTRLLIGFVLLTAVEVLSERLLHPATFSWFGYFYRLMTLFGIPILMIMSKFSNIRLIPGKIFPFHIQLLNTLKISGFRSNRDDTPFSSALYNLRIDTPSEQYLSALLYSRVQVVERDSASGTGLVISGILADKYWVQEDEVFFGFVPESPLLFQSYRHDLWLIKAKTTGERFYKGYPEAIVFLIPQGTEIRPGSAVSDFSPRIRCFVKPHL